jgi:hypothetical protein
MSKCRGVASRNKCAANKKHISKRRNGGKNALRSDQPHALVRRPEFNPIDDFDREASFVSRIVMEEVGSKIE